MYWLSLPVFYAGIRGLLSRSAQYTIRQKIHHVLTSQYLTNLKTLLLILSPKNRTLEFAC